MSKESTNSKYVDAEWQQAFDDEVIVFPVYIEDCEPSRILLTRQAIDARGDRVTAACTITQQLAANRLKKQVWCANEEDPFDCLPCSSNF